MDPINIPEGLPQNIEQWCTALGTLLATVLAMWWRVRRSRRFDR